jgi:hypothetical protein
MLPPPAGEAFELLPSRSAEEVVELAAEEEGAEVGGPGADLVEEDLKRSGSACRRSIAATG